MVLSSFRIEQIVWSSNGPSLARDLRSLAPNYTTQDNWPKDIKGTFGTLNVDCISNSNLYY